MPSPEQPLRPPPSASLEESIAALCTSVEALSPGARTGVCIASKDCQKLERAVFPNLPHTFQAGIREIPMGPPYFGSCTAAMDGREIITAHDLSKESRFDQHFVAHCLNHSVRALQSRPVFDEEGRPLGTFVMGFTEPRSGSDFDEALMTFAADATAEMLKRER